jgi:hypothetical protein
LPNERIFFEEQALEFEEFISHAPARLTPAQARYLAEFLRRKPTDLIRNIGPVRKAVAAVGQTVVPLVINDGGADRCYLASPYVHYIAYMKFEVKKMRPLLVSWSVRALLTAMGFIFRALQFDKFVSINNWFFTTSMQVTLDPEEIARLRHVLERNFPAHAWVFRGLKRPSHEELLKALLRSGFQLLIHRPVFEWRPQDYLEKKFKRHIRQQVRHDLALSEGHPYSISHPEKMTAEQADHIARLYEDLYIRKHSDFNAHFTPAFFELALSSGINRLALLRIDGRTVGFATTCLDSDRLVACLLGYDQAACRPPLPRPYSAVVGEAFRQSLESQKLLFLSTGVASFKKRRGAYESMEYEAFEVSHLGLHRRIPWYAMKKFLDAAIAIVDTGAI